MVLVNVFPIVIILVVPYMDFVASLLTIANVKVASILESQFQIIVIYVIFASTYLYTVFFLKAVYFHFHFSFMRIVPFTVVCKKVHKIGSVWCKMALGEVGVSHP